MNGRKKNRTDFVDIQAKIRSNHFQQKKKKNLEVGLGILKVKIIHGELRKNR